MQYSSILPTAEPFFFPGGKTGCLLVHGFTGTPKEMRWLGEYLHDQGHSVLGVRLAGHATRPEDMIRTRWWDWLASVEDGWHFLRGCSEQVIVIGLSLGGILALLFASRFPVTGVVAMATPHHLPNDPRIPLIKPISLFQPFFPKGKPDWHDSLAAADHVSYTVDPTRSYAELRDALALLPAALPEIYAPALLVYSKDDPTVRTSERHAEQILQGLASPEKELIWVENSGHVVTRDAARQEVFQVVGDFTRRTAEAGY